MRTKSGKRSNKHARLPRWAWLVCVFGGVVAYFSVGSFLEGPRFLPKLQDLFDDPGAFNTDNMEEVAPFFLLFIPAVLGGFGAREMLRIVFDGRRDGDSAPIIFKKLALNLLSWLTLLIAAFFSSGRGRR